MEIKAIYGGGFGDQFTSVKIEDNSSADSLPRTFTVDFGKDEHNESVSGLLTSDWQLTAGTVSEVNATGGTGNYVVSITPDASISPTWS